MADRVANAESTLLLRRAIDELCQGFYGDAPPDENWRAAARLQVARLLALVIRHPDPTERDELRRVVESVGRLVEVPHDIHNLRAFKRDVEYLQAAVARPAAEAGRVLRFGSGASNFQRMTAVSETRTLGLLGQVLGPTSEGVVLGAVLAGALAVAGRGMRSKLDASTVLMVLDRALKDTLPGSAPVAMCAWSFDNSTGQLKVASAGHRGVWLLRGGTFVAIRPRPGEMLGTATRAYVTVSEPLHSKDVLVSFTQGLLEQEGASGELLSERDLRFALLDAEPGLDSAHRALRNTLTAHRASGEWDVEATALLWQVP